jgi:hypothetical protein
MGYDFKYWECFAGGEPMGQPKSDKEFMHPGAGSAASDAPTIGPFVASIEATREAAAAPARWSRVLDEFAETSGQSLLRERHNERAAGDDAGH